MSIGLETFSGARTAQVGGQYRASYYEISRMTFTSHMDSIISAITPPDLRVGNATRKGDILCRVFALPNSQDARLQRVSEITAAGSDRTNPLFDCESAEHYEWMAEQAGIQPSDVIDCFYDRTLFAEAETDGMTSLLENYYANAVLLYDGKSREGLRHLGFVEYTFKKPNQRNRALLAIVGLTD